MSIRIVPTVAFRRAVVLNRSRPVFVAGFIVMDNHLFEARDNPQLERTIRAPKRLDYL